MSCKAAGDQTLLSFLNDVWDQLHHSRVTWPLSGLMRHLIDQLLYFVRLVMNTWVPWLSSLLWTWCRSGRLPKRWCSWNEVTNTKGLTAGVSIPQPGLHIPVVICVTENEEGLGSNMFKGDPTCFVHILQRNCRLESSPQWVSFKCLVHFLWQIFLVNTFCSKSKELI